MPVWAGCRPLGVAGGLAGSPRPAPGAASCRGPALRDRGGSTVPANGSDPFSVQRWRGPGRSIPPPCAGPASRPAIGDSQRCPRICCAVPGRGTPMCRAGPICSAGHEPDGPTNTIMRDAGPTVHGRPMLAEACWRGATLKPCNGTGERDVPTDTTGPRGKRISSRARRWGNARRNHTDRRGGVSPGPVLESGS